MSESPTIDLPATPRPASAAARRQSWREAPVRRWVLATVGVGIVIAAVGVRAGRATLDERRLQRDGTRVDAIVEQMAGQGRDADRATARQVKLSVRLPGDTESRELNGLTTPMVGRLTLGQPIPIIVDPADRSHWTDRIEPRPWTSALAGPLLISPALLILAGTAWRQRARALSTWRDGAIARGQVLDVQTSAMVPGQKLLRVSLPAVAGAAARTVVVTHPDRLGARQRGDAVDVIVARDGRSALSAAAYAPVTIG